MFRGMSDAEVWIDSTQIKVLRGRLGGRLGEAAIVFAAMLIALFAPALLGLHVGGAIWAWLLGAALATLFGLFVRRNISQGAGTIGVVGGALVIVQGRKKKAIPLADLVEGRSSPRRGEIDLGLRGGAQIVAAVPSSEEAERLLVAAGLDASKRTMRFELGETTFLTWMTFLLGPAAVVPVTTAIIRLMPLRGGVAAFVYCAVFVLLFVGLFQLVRALWGPAKLIVGADGIVVDRTLRDEFVPFGRLASMTMKHDRVTLRLDDGSRVRARARHLNDVQQSELKARIDAAIAAFHGGENAAEALSQLDRAGRPIAAWRAAMDALLERQATYRETPLTREQLFAVLESAAAPAERRLAAAVSLSAGGEPEVATRIRIAADACARPRVRLALQGVAEREIDDAAIEAALAEEDASKVARP